MVTLPPLVVVEVGGVAAMVILRLGEGKMVRLLNNLKINFKEYLLCVDNLVIVLAIVTRLLGGTNLTLHLVLW